MMSVLRSLFLVVTLVAGVAGIVMLALPADTDDYFSWAIGPPPLTATVGAFYVASALLFGLAAAEVEWFRVRPLCFGVLALTLPTIAFTIHHEEVFDFGRWQAVAWVILFVASPLAFGTILVLQRGLAAPASPALSVPARAIVSGLGIAYAALALAIWIDPDAVGERGPFALVGLSGRYGGCWLALLATLAAYPAIRNRSDEAFLPAVALTLWPIAAFLASFRSWDELETGAPRTIYLVVLVVLAVAGGAVMGAPRRWPNVGRMLH